MKKRLLILEAAAVLLFGGCGMSLPDMTNEQAAAIGEYAAISLLKHDANSRSRLVELPQTEESKGAEEDAGENTPAPEPDFVDTTVIDITEVKENVNEAESIESFLDWAAGMTVSYVGEEVCQSYSEEGNDYFVLEASPGKSLLVLKFQISNGSGSGQQIDMLHRKDTYRITVNESYSRTALTTMLSNDMSTYLGTIEQGETKEVVLLIEIEAEQAEALSSISLNLKNDTKVYSTQLR